ncbi:hypothetical protein [Fluviicola taffensis]|uniref:Uncharacterized protein n=1 Tax=Fluviicola taffensis (strain DSM 16823 / NCIMB 13979 / RW262) TaxID=755732 RepID=F2I928_FLUTR|nr:hypothetical protein [Fluviicola taffensis]AEA42975.1 hypothetical protein Fluta_0974 [Fluviicola taffensis DSM 16823]
MISSLKNTSVLATLLLSFSFYSSLSAQNNALGVNDEFMELLIQMGPEMKPPKNIGSYVMEQALEVPIDQKLAFKYLWQSNEYLKEEEAFCNSIGFLLNKESSVAILFFYKGQAESLFYLIDVQTYNYKTGKLIDEINGVAGFKGDDAVCNMQVNSYNEIVFKTLAAGQTNEIVLNISNKGKIQR